MTIDASILSEKKEATFKKNNDKSYQLSTVFSLLGGRWAGEAEPVGLRSALAEWAGEALELAGGWTMPAKNKILKNINYRIVFYHKIDEKIH